MKAAKNKTKYGIVLLIDDDGIDNFINERIVTSTNFAETVLVKTTVKDSLDYLKSNAGDELKLPEIIFLDINMPVVDGFEFLEQFEKIYAANDAIKKKCKIIVLSSSVSPEDINRVSLNPRVYKYINKPLSENYLNAINY